MMLLERLSSVVYENEALFIVRIEFQENIKGDK